MKVYPPRSSSNITIQHNISTDLSQAESLATILFSGKQKKLLRLPHIFTRVLELPFNSDADVFIEENPNFIRFTVMTDEMDEDVQVHTTVIYPGITKTVIGNAKNSLRLSLEDLDLDRWRFRLPCSTRPELATASCVAREFIVTIPKGLDCNDSSPGANHLVLAQ